MLQLFITYHLGYKIRNRHLVLKDPGSGPRYLSGFKGPRSSALAPAQDPVIFAPGSSHSEPAVGERGLQTLCVD